VFHYAAVGGDVDVMQFLIERGANAHALAKVREVSSRLGLMLGLSDLLVRSCVAGLLL
jgi:hypothetical protein